MISLFGLRTQRALLRQAYKQPQYLCNLRAFSSDISSDETINNNSIINATSEDDTNDFDDESDEIVPRQIDLTTSKIISTSKLLQANYKDRLKFFNCDKILEKDFIPEGISKQMAETFDLIGNNHIMLRSHTYKVLRIMRSWDKLKAIGKQPTNYIFDGLRGTGKSFALQQLVQFAREQEDWIVLYIPRARAWCYDAPYIEKSSHFPGKFDIDVYGVELLTQFRTAHEKQLALLPLHGSYDKLYYQATEHSKRPSSGNSEASTILDLVISGIQEPELACKALVDLRTELAQVTSQKVLIAIDQYNAWYEDTIFQYEIKKVMPEEISVIDAYRIFNQDGFIPSKKFQNGFYLTATTKQYTPKKELMENIKYKKYRLLMQKYTAEELQAIIEYYNDVGFLEDTWSESEIAYFRLLTNSVPLNVLERASYS